MGLLRFSGIFTPSNEVVVFVATIPAAPCFRQHSTILLRSSNPRSGATFTNIGQRSVLARYIGDIRVDEKVVQTIETESLRVQPQESVELIDYFTPRKPGEYVVQGRVRYNEKVTFQKGTVINVNYPPDYGKGVRLLPVIIYVTLIALILYLIWRIRRDKNESR